MATYRFYNPVPVIFDIQGLRPAIGGSLTFYAKGTNTPKDTHSDQAGAVPNPNPMTLDGSGRPTTDIWLTGAYTVVAKTSGGVVIDEADIDTPVPPGISLPAPAAGKFIQGNGTQWVAVDLFLLPDPVGSDGFAVVASGGGYGLAPFPVAPAPNSVISAGSFKQGDGSGTNFCLQQWGSGSAPATGDFDTQLAVTFAAPYAATPIINVTPTGGPFANGNYGRGYYADVSIIASSTTGFTVKFNTNHGETNSDANIITPVTFGWHAIGLTTS